MPYAVTRTFNQDIDGVTWGSAWSDPNNSNIPATHLTYSISTGVGTYLNNGYFSVTGFQQVNAAGVTALKAVIANLNLIIPLNITVAPAGEVGNIRYAFASKFDDGGGRGSHEPGNGTAEAEVPTDDPQYQIPFHAQGDVWFGLNEASYKTPTLGSFGYAAAFLHETGHALGLKHGHVDGQSNDPSNGPNISWPGLPDDHDSQEYSVMTYQRSRFDTLNTRPSNYDGAHSEYPSTYMQDDIAALQHIYGANFTARATNTIYKWDPVNGALIVNGVEGAGTFHGKIFLTIWDGNGEDTYDLSNFSNGVLIDLRPGNFSRIDTRTAISGLSDLSAEDTSTNANNFARGNIYNALLYQGDLRSLIENGIGGAGSDHLIGNQVGNKLSGNAGGDELDGLEGDDVLNGGAGNDQLFGYIGNDTLNGGAGNDTLDGGGDNDTYVFSGTDSQFDTIVETSGTDTVQVIGAADLVLNFFSTAASSIEIWTGNSKAIFGNGNNNTLFFFGLTSATGITYISGSGGNDFISGTNLANVVDDLRGDAGDDTINGNIGNDKLNGGAGNDTLDGGAGNDTITGGAGNDTLSGGDNDDTFIIAGKDAQFDTFDGGNGTDTIKVTGTLDVVLNFFSTAANSIEIWTGNNTAIFGDGTDNTLFLFGLTAETGITFISGGAGNDFISGTNLSGIIDDLRGDAGDDTINGNLGNDKLNGGDGNDTLNGGDGNDTLTGGNGNDTMNGGDGDDTLNGGAGNDAYNGNAGNDSFLITGTQSQFDTFDGGADTDRIVVQGATAVTLSAFNATTSSIETWQGNGLGVNGTAGNDTLDFSGLANVVKLGQLFGGAGNDVISGTNLSSVIDDLRGDAGDDTINGNLGNDKLNGGDGNDTLNGGDGNDTLTGGNGDDTMNGGNDDDTLDGGAGNDAYNGNAGNDSFLITGTQSQFDTFDGGADTDRIVVQGATAVTLSAFNATTSSIETWQGNGLGVNGTAGNDTLDFSGLVNIVKLGQLFGGTGDDTIVGSTLADTIKGGIGSDTLTGGGGNDIFLYTNPNEGGDHITDFISGQDHIKLLLTGFAGASTARLILGTDPFPTTNKGTFLFDTDTGELSWDRDGNGAAAAAKILTLDGIHTLNSSDLLLA